MKVLAIREAKAGLSATLDEAQRERVLITRNGKPSAIVIGVEGHDFEDVLLMSNPKFWEMIEASRRNPTTYTMEEIRQHFADRDAKERSAPPKRAKRPTPRNGKRRKST
jgi:prevent-host-death family protein